MRGQALPLTLQALLSSCLPRALGWKLLWAAGASPSSESLLEFGHESETAFPGPSGPREMRASGKQVCVRRKREEREEAVSNWNTRGINPASPLPSSSSSRNAKILSVTKLPASAFGEVSLSLTYSGPRAFPGAAHPSAREVPERSEDALPASSLARRALRAPRRGSPGPGGGQ